MPIGKCVKGKHNMTEGISSGSAASVQSMEDRQNRLADWQKKLTQARQQKLADMQKKQTQDKQKKRTFDYMSKEESENESPFLSNADMKDRQSPFLSNDDIAKRQTPFLTEDMLPSERPEPFLTNDINAERPSPFLERQENTQNTQSPLEIQRPEEDEETEEKTFGMTLPLNDNVILAELKRNPMRGVLTARDIAQEYSVSYQKAIDLFKELNADSNGIAREFNLPDENATLSFLV